MSIRMIEERKRALDFLQNHKTGVLATVDPNGDPHGAAIYFTVNDSLNVFFLTKIGTRKHDNMQRNNHAALVVYEPSSQTTVQLKGIVSEVTDTTRTRQVFADIFKASMDTSEAGIPPISKLQAGKYIVYKLEPKEIRMAVFERPDPGDYETIFETIYP